MDFKAEFQLIEDLEAMERKLARGWTRGYWAVGFVNPHYCLTGAMNKTITGVAEPLFANFAYDFRAKSERKNRVLKELGFSSRSQAEHWNDSNTKGAVLTRIRNAISRVRKRVEKEQLRVTREAAAAAAKLAKDRCFVQEWLDKPREDPLVVPEVWPEPIPEAVKVES